MKKKFAGILLLGLILLAPVMVRAFDTTCVPNPNNPLDPGCVTSLQTKDQVISFLFGFLNILRDLFWILAVGMLLYSAYLYLFGGGNDKNVESAKKFLRYAVTAMVIALVATSIPFLVRSLLGG